jgi:hypothetical protein
MTKNKNLIFAFFALLILLSNNGCKSISPSEIAKIKKDIVKKVEQFYDNDFFHKKCSVESTLEFNKIEGISIEKIEVISKNGNKNISTSEIKDNKIISKFVRTSNTVFSDTWSYKITVKVNDEIINTTYDIDLQSDNSDISQCF